MLNFFMNFMYVFHVCPPCNRNTYDEDDSVQNPLCLAKLSKVYITNINLEQFYLETSKFQKKEF